MNNKILPALIFSFLISLTSILNAQNCEVDSIPPVMVCQDIVTIDLNTWEGTNTLTPDLFNEGSFDPCGSVIDFRIGFGNGDGAPPSTTSLDLPAVGIYTVVLWGINQAGRWNQCWSSLRVVDCQGVDTEAPQLVCLTGLAANLSPLTNTALIWAQDFVQSVSDNCSVPTLVVEPGGPGSQPPLSTSLIFDSPGTYPITVWAGDQVGNWSNCATFLTINGVDPDARKISGTVFLDLNQNCQYDTEEGLLEDWDVQVRPFENGFPVDNTFTLRTAQTDASGTYTFHLGGPYLAVYDSLELRISAGINLPQNCPTTYIIPTSDLENEQALIRDFPIQLQENCHQLQVDISAPFLRRCFEGGYFVSYCNYGSLTAPNAYVDITLDPYLNFIGSAWPHANTTGNTYRFPLGDIPPGACGQFNFLVGVSCESELGQTHCTKAKIYPNQACGGSYSGARIEVEGSCDETNERVRFKIKNVGGEDMSGSKNYLVVEDVIMYMNDGFNLGAGGEFEVDFPANGSTYRLEAEQPDGYPWYPFTSATVEGCGQNENGGISLGFVTAFSQIAAGPFVDIDCQENIGSYDPNDKQAFPRGVGEEHLLSSNTPIEYKIRFQNTGTDTAFTVVILDSLSEWLDITTVRPGASSHDYSFQILKDRTLEFRFTDILLPDSSTNEPASNGFVQFFVEQLPDNPNGTLIENEAAIYFDFNEAVITNTVFHKIGKLFITVDTEEPILGTVKLKVFPNPFSEQINFVLPEVTTGDLRIHNIQGQLIYQTSFNGGSISLPASNLTKAGIYSYQLRTQTGQLYRGKIIARTAK